MRALLIDYVLHVILEGSSLRVKRAGRDEITAPQFVIKI